MERKNKQDENQQIKLQKAPSRANIMKVPNPTNVSPQKRMIKIDLKLQYLLNELNSTRKFKDFLQDLNLTAKQVIKNANQISQAFSNNDKPQKKKNSFNLTTKLEQQNLTHKNGEKISQKDQTSIKKQKETKINHLAQKVDIQKLQQIKELIQSKKTQILNHIQMIRKRMSNSSIWDDKYFYDFTESNYQQKMEQVEENLRITEKNLQEKQKQKKVLNITPDALIIRTKCIKYSCYEQNSDQRKIADQNYLVKRKIMTELKRINQLQNKLSTVLQQNAGSNQNIQQSKESNSQQKQSQNDHPYIQSIKRLKNEFKKISAQISVKKKIKQNFKTSQVTQKSPDILVKLIQLFNQEILYQQMSKTKRRISQLKHQTQNLQNSIKELQGFKALIILRNKKIQTCINKDKNSSNLVENLNFDDQILKQILEHQFLNKNLSLKIQTKFCCLKKKNVNSYSDANLNKKINYFPHIKKFKKYCSEKKLKNFPFLQINQLKENQKNSPTRKNIKIEVVSSKYCKNKQPGSSAETNP